MNKILKRMAEIRARKAEIRKTLEGEGEVNFDELDEELRSLDEEYEGLERRFNTLNTLNMNGGDGANPVGGAAGADGDGGDSGEERANMEPKEYRAAWLKRIRNLELTDAETRALTTADGSAGAVVPTVTQNKIIEKVNQFCPLLEKIDLLRVPGGAKVPAEGSTTEAKVHTEGAVITADSDTLVYVTVMGYEVTKLVTISKSVERMSIDAFEAWLVNKIARKVAEKIGALIFAGSGTGEAQGIDKIEWDENNSVEVASSGSLAAADVQKAVSLLPGGYDDGAEWYMSKKTFFGDFHPLMNKSKDNIVTEDNGVYRVMGYPVSMDDRVKEHEAYLGNLYRGYLGNMPEDVNVTSQFVTRENAYDFLGCAMFDGKVQATEAFVKIKKAAE